MNTLYRQVTKARRMLWLQSILNVFSWSLIIAFTVCFLGLLVPKILFLPSSFANWNYYWLGGAAVVSIAVTAIIASINRPTVIQSAIELDRRFNLRERTSSALQLDESERATPIGQALVLDAENKADRIDVRDQFPIRPAPHSPWVLLPCIACAALFWVPNAQLSEEVALKIKSNSEKLTKVRNVAQKLIPQIEKQIEAAEEKGLEDAAEDFRRLQKKLEELQKLNELDEKKALTDFHEIQKELRLKKDSLGSADSMKKMLDGLKDLDEGPADKVAKALKDGDFERASEELEKVLDQLASNNLTSDQEKQLTKQLDQMQKAIEKSNEKRKQAIQNAKSELEKAKKEGDLEKAAKLQKKLEQLESTEKQSKAAEKCKECMNAAKEAMSKGDKEGAKQALEELQEMIEDMAEDQEAADDLAEMMDEMESEAGGNGNKKMQDARNGQGKKNERPGDGMGEGEGEGERPEEEGEVNHVDQQVREQMRKGATINGGKVGGKNRKGITREEAREAILSAKPEDPDALENLSLPKAQREQQREYYDALRGDKKK